MKEEKQQITESELIQRVLQSEKKTTKKRERPPNKAYIIQKKCYFNKFVLNLIVSFG
jgi:hypothetical protein